jgi:predicted amidohydrolase
MPPTVAACQLAVDDLDPATNLAVVESRIRSLPDPVDIAVFPEYALTGFVPDDRVADTALRVDGERISGLRDLAAAESTAVLVGFVEAEDDDLYNTTAYLAPDGDITRYRKRHLWGRESDVLTAGDDLVTVETPVGRAGILTCYDLNFVADSAELVERGVDALFVGGAWPAAYSENWRLLLRARALDGVRWVVGAGRTGRREVAAARSESDEDTATDAVAYAGRSLVIRPDGGIHASLDRREDDLVADLDSETLAAHREFIGSV